MARARHGKYGVEDGDYFDDYGRPQGQRYGQYSPFTDQPQEPSAEQQAIGQALKGEAQPRQSLDYYQNAQARTQATPVELQPPAAQQPASGAQPRSSSNRSRGYGILDQYDDPYERRLEGPGGVWSNAAKYAQTGAGIGSAFAGVGAIPGAIIGGIGGAIGGAFSKNAKTAMTDLRIEDAREMLGNAYTDMFGRPADPAYVQEALTGQGWQQGDRWAGEDGLSYILDQWYQQAQQEQQQNAAAPAASAEAAATQAALTQPGPLGAHAGSLEGYNMDRFQDPSQPGNNTWKYRVGSVLSNYAPDREGLAAATAALRAQGVDVSQSDGLGDRLIFGAGVTDDQGNPIGTVDVGRGFGAAGSGWAWQPEGAAGAGAAAGDAQSAYDSLVGSISPGASKEEMEAAITAAFRNVPGFQGAYKESVNINGQWYDLVSNYGGAGAAWQGLAPKGESGGGGFASSGTTQAILNALRQGQQPSGDTNSYSRQLLEEIMRSLALNQALGNA